MVQVFPITDSFFHDFIWALLFTNCMQILIFFITEFIKSDKTPMFLFWYFGNQIAGFLWTLNNFAHHEHSFSLNCIDCNFSLDWMIFDVVKHKLLVWTVSHLYRIFFSWEDWFWQKELLLCHLVLWSCKCLFCRCLCV